MLKRILIVACLVLTSCVAVAGVGKDGQATTEPLDVATALKHWRPLAEQGDATAQFYLGVLYEKGRGVPKDYVQAVAWYRKAAQQGLAEAQSSLGFMYATGRGVPKDYVQAYMWLSLAVALGLEAGAKILDGELAKRMTPDQIAEAQKMAREWWAKHPQ